MEGGHKWALEDSDTAAYAEARLGGYLRAPATPEDLPLLA